MAWRGAVGSTGAVEVGQDVLAAADQGSGQGLDLLQPVGDGLPQGLSCTGWGGLCFRVGFFVGILGVGWLFRLTHDALVPWGL